VAENKLVVNVCFGDNELDITIESEKDMNILMEFIEEMNSKRKKAEINLPKVPDLD